EMPAHLLADEGASRFGMAHYHNPEVLRLINELENEFKMLRLLDMVLFAEDRAEAIEESAERYEQRLLNCNSAGREAAKLLTYPRAEGNSVQKLEKKYPDRVKKPRTGERNPWILYPPAGGQLPLGGGVERRLGGF